MADAVGWSALDWAALVARVALGAVLVYSGLAKAVHPVEFLKLLREYQLTAAPLVLNGVAALLPWFEVVCGFLLVAGIGVRGTALVSLSMLVPFTAVVIARTLAIQAETGAGFCSIQFDCGCGFGAVRICSKLVENGALILCAAWLTAQDRSPAAWRFALVGPGRRVVRGSGPDQG